MRRVAVRGIAVHEGKLLCVRHTPYSKVAAAGRDWWCLPGGTVDDGEALETALVREMQEETGISPQVGRLLYVHQFAFKEAEHLEFFFHIANPQDYQNIDLQNTTHGAAEIEQIGFVDPKATVILPAFLTHEPLEERIAQHAPVTIFSFQR